MRYRILSVIAHIADGQQQVNAAYIEPDQRNQQGEGTVPFIVLGQPLRNSLLNLMVVDKEAGRSNADNQKVDTNANQAAVHKTEIHAEEVGHHKAQQICQQEAH